MNYLYPNEQSEQNEQNKYSEIIETLENELRKLNFKQAYKHRWIHFNPDTNLTISICYNEPNGRIIITIENDKEVITDIILISEQKYRLIDALDEIKKRQAYQPA